MRIRRGDIWSLVRLKYMIVIPVNIGWKKSGENIMGRGLAKDALERYPGIDKWLGEQQKRFWENLLVTLDETYHHCRHEYFINVHPEFPLIFFPTKELNVEKPWMSWSNKSSKEYIIEMLDCLKLVVDSHDKTRMGKIAVPLLGAGNGGLDPIDMRDSIREKMGDDPRFVLISDSV